MSLLQNWKKNDQLVVVVILGPTASGKTCLSIKLAEKLKLSIFNIDSRQLYTGMDIGTAKPTKSQQKRIKHHLIDLRQPNDPITMNEFQRTGSILINENLTKEGACLLVGGSGLYLKAITHGLCPPPVPPQQTIRSQFNDLGQSICHSLLQTADPIAAKKIHKADIPRTQRALEVLYATGEPLSNQQRKNPPPWKIIEIGLNPRNLSERIFQRTREIYKMGLINETKFLSERFTPQLPLLQTIGYGEALKVLNGKLKLEDAIALTTKRTLQFAKRQRTWFRTQHQAHWIQNEDPLNESLSAIKAGLELIK